MSNPEPNRNPTPSTELIPLAHTDDGITAVMGRDLHAFLESKEPYTVWFKRMVGYGFSEGQDYLHKNLKIERPAPLPPVDKQDHILTMDMAKEVAMIQRSAKGQQARRYFIEVERRYRAGLGRPAFDPAKVTRLELAQMLLDAETERLELETANKALRPKADAYDSFLDASGAYSLGTVAKMLGLGQNTLFAQLRSHGVLISGGALRNTPYQRHMRFFEVKARRFEKRGGETGVSYTTLVRPAGIDFIRRTLGLPSIDPVAPILF